MKNEEILAILIGRTVGLFPENVKQLLQKNAIVANPANFNSSELISAVFVGLKSSESFKNDLASFIEENKELI